MILLISAYLWLSLDNTSLPFWETIEKKFSSDEEAKEENMVHMIRQDGTSLKLSIDEYLEGVIGSEMSASFEIEALKAQCVASRTFVVQRGYEVDDTTRTQVYHDDKQLNQIWGTDYEKYHERIVKAIEETKNEIMTYEGKPITAAFFSSSCGKTANSEEYWQKETPYLQSVDSSWDTADKSYKQTVVFSEEDFHTLLGFENTISEISETQYYDSGYVKNIVIDGISFSGREIREKLNLRSSCFSIKKQKDGYHITTQGYGHGIGMSQIGAQQMALQGKTYKDILNHYYTDVKIDKLNV